jgi:hypothetical protein
MPSLPGRKCRKDCGLVIGKAGIVVPSYRNNDKYSRAKGNQLVVDKKYVYFIKIRVFIDRLFSTLSFSLLKS